jgi:hypothetical protein
MKKKKILERLEINDGSIDILINRMVMIEESLSELNFRLDGKSKVLSGLEQSISDWHDKNIPIIEGMGKVDEQVLDETARLYRESNMKDDLRMRLNETVGIREKVKDLNATLPIAESIVKELAEEFFVDPRFIQDNDFFVYSCMMEYHKQMMTLICQ